MNKKNLAFSSGQGLTEYLILLLLISLVSLSATRILGNTIKRKLELAQRHLESEVSLSSSQ